MATAKLDLEKFMGKNDFGLWKLKMKVVMMQHGLWEILKRFDGKAEAAGDEKAAAKGQEVQERAYSTLILSLSDRVLWEVSKEETAADIWAKLESLYMAKSLTNRLHLKQKLFTFKIIESKNILEQLEKFGKCVDDLDMIDEKLKDEDKALMLLNSLTSCYEQFKDAILLGRDSKVTYEEVYSALKLKEIQRSNSKSSDTAAEVLNVNNDVNKNGKKKGQKKPWKEKSGEGKETRSCHHCKKPGHLKKDCYALKRKLAEEKKLQDTADLAEQVEVAQVMNVIDKTISESWVMDSGCSFHLTSHREWIIEVEECGGSVLLGNDHVCHVKAKGKVRFVMDDGSLIVLTEVRFILEIKRNLISLGRLERKGFEFASKEGIMRVVKDGEVLMKAKRCNNLYYLQAPAICSEVNLSESLDLKVWNKRQGHVGVSRMKELIKSGVIPASSVKELEGVPKCEQCILGKKQETQL